MRTLIVMMTTLASVGALASTLAAASEGAGPRVADLEVFRDGLTFVASGSFAPGAASPSPVLVRARGLVSGSCVHPRVRGAQPFALPMVLMGTAATRRAGREATFFVRTSPPEVAAAEVCPGPDWRVAPTDIEFSAIKLQIGRPGARVLCQFPAVDGRIDDPGCQFDS